MVSTKKLDLKWYSLRSFEGPKTCPPDSLLYGAESSSRASEFFLPRLPAAHRPRRAPDSAPSLNRREPKPQNEKEA
jgi:hypothetical protein